MKSYWGDKKKEDKRIRDENKVLKKMLADSKKTQVPSHMQSAMSNSKIMEWK